MLLSNSQVHSTNSNTSYGLRQLYQKMLLPYEEFKQQQPSNIDASVDAKPEAAVAVAPPAADSSGLKPEVKPEQAPAQQPAAPEQPAGPSEAGPSKSAKESSGQQSSKDMAEFASDFDEAAEAAEILEAMLGLDRGLPEPPNKKRKVTKGKVCVHTYTRLTCMSKVLKTMCLPIL